MSEYFLGDRVCPCPCMWLKNWTHGHCYACRSAQHYEMVDERRRALSKKDEADGTR